MDARGTWRDNVFIERLWRSLKYECIYLNAFDTVREAHRQIGLWMDYYNRVRPLGAGRADTGRGLSNELETGRVSLCHLMIGKNRSTGRMAAPIRM